MKKILSLLLVAMMLTSMLPVMVQAESTVSITFSAYDSTNKQFVHMPAELEVAAGTAAKYGFENSSTYVGENQITVMDAFVAAHEALYNAEKIQSMWDGLSTGFVTKMFGISGSIGFMINDEFATDGFSRGYGISEAVIKSGDDICFFTYADTYWGDYYSYFDTKEKTVAPGESFNLTLSAYEATELMYATPGEPTPSTYKTLKTVSGASVMALDPATGALDKSLAITDSEGKVTLSFAEEGTYYVSATAKVTGTYSEVPIIAPWCKVTVKTPSDDTIDNTITTYITISKYGKIVDDKNGSAVALAPVELKGKESYTLDDLFKAAHDLYYEGGAEAGYSTYESSWGLSVGTMWGDTSGDVLYQINGGKVYVSGPANKVHNGDCIDTYILQSYAENYAYFDKYTAEVAAGEALSLTLTEMGYDAAYNTVYMPSADATITIDGAETEYKTDAEGKVNLTFDRPGTYVVSASKTNGEVTAISAPVCVVTVTLPDGYYNVTVKVGPSTASVKFYNCDGFDENKKDILGEEITAFDDGVISKYHQYTLIAPKGRYSFRGTDANGASLGGMTFTVPPVGAAEDSTEHTIALRQLDIYTTTKYDGTNYATENEYSTTVQDHEENFATAGAPYKSGSFTRYPYMIWALGGTYPYSIEIIPDATIAEKYSLGTNTMTGYGVNAGIAIATKSGTIPTIFNATVNAPAGAKVQVFKQIKNFYTEEVSASSTTDGENGTINHTYRLPKNDSKHTYRVSMDGKITKAGYFNLKTEQDAQVTVTFAENEDPKARPEYDRSVATEKNIEDSILLNINKQNYLRLEQGEEFTARAYRALQIVNSNTSNIMIEPDFHYSIISGDSVTLEEQGHKAVLKAVKDGISVIEVTYDAIQVGSTLYGAVDPSRKGIFVVNVGGDSSTAIDMTDWDSDLDTVYFLGETGTFNFAPTADTEMTVEADGTVVSANADGSYTIPVKQGNNIISVTAGSTTEYLVVKGDKLTANIVNVTNPDSPIKQGDTIQVSFDGLHMPVPKFAGVYNPGYGSTMKIGYALPNGGKVLSKGTQYDFISNHTITFNVFDEGTLKLTGGSIPMTCMGSEFGSHRGLTDEGIPANFNAAEVAGDFSILPDVEIEVLKNEDLSYLSAAKETFTNLAKVNILCGIDSWSKSFRVNHTTEALASVKNTNTTFNSINASYPLTVNAETVNSGVTMELRYWEEGDTEKKTTPLASGETLNLGTGVFSGNKTINMEIAVTPVNPIFGETKVYSYVFYKTSDGFERAVLQTLEINDAQNAAFAPPYGILRSENGKGLAYTQTDYYCYVPTSAEQVTVNLARLIGTTDVTVNGETKEVATSATAFTPIALEEEETLVTITVADGRTYTVKVIKTDDIIVENTAYKGDLASVTLTSPVEKAVNVFVGVYEDITLSSLACNSSTLAAGETTVFVDCTKLGTGDKYILVWDENMTEITGKTAINTKD